MVQSRLKTLILDANGIPLRETVFFDTVFRGILGLRTTADDFPPALSRNRHIRKYFGQRYESLSYIIDWREAFCEAPALDVRVCNLLDLVGLASCRKALEQYPLVVILHSANADNMLMLNKIKEWFKHRKGKLAMFVNNEYELLDQKIEFINSVQMDFICSQLPIGSARWLYAACDHSQVLATPHALNPKMFHPGSMQQRNIDIGFVGDLYARTIGDQERTALIESVQQRCTALELACDFRYQRLSRSGWAQFLRSCKGIVGAESGTYYLDRRGEGIARAKAYSKAHPQASMDEIVENCFAGLEHVSGKAISSRHFEPVGTRTCQVLVEGQYNGILKADEHYISVKKDLSNIDDALERFLDDGYRTRMVENALEYVMSAHTYKHRVDAFLETVLQ